MVLSVLWNVMGLSFCAAAFVCVCLVSTST